MSGADAPLVEVDGLEKRFRVRARGLRGLLPGTAREVTAVAGVSFAIAPGERVGCLGPNGAGKSTTLKVLTGLLVPSSGRVEVAGRVPWRERRDHVARIGAVFGQRTTLWWDLPTIESLELLRHVYDVPAARFRANLASFTELLELGPFLDTPVRALSLGQRMRADLAAALLHDPPLLLLDEPTIGLDVVAKERIRTFIKRRNREHGTTVLLTTHDLADVQRLCERVLILDRGRLLYDGDLDALQRRFGGPRELRVDFAAPETVTEPRVPGAELIEWRSGRARYRFDPAAIGATELIRRAGEVGPVRDLAVLEPDIEATVRSIYEGRRLEDVESDSGGKRWRTPNA